MAFQQFINKMASNPKQLFLIDGIGAIVSAFSLGVILVQFERFFGMPHDKLYILALVAGVFAVYSLFCYFKTPENWRPFLRLIAISNSIYCCVTAVLVILLFDQLTDLGAGYFLLELVIIIILVSIEFSVTKKESGSSKKLIVKPSQ